MQKRGRKIVRYVGILLVTFLLIVLSIPEPYAVTDGGSYGYSAVLWGYEKVHRICDCEESTHYVEGTVVRILFWPFSNVKQPECYYVAE